jgi:IMP dehydrogenase
MSAAPNPTTRIEREIPLCLTFDDVLLKPQFSTLRSRRMADISSYVTKNIKLNIPIVASNMMDVCEERMSIAMARAGGIGFIHRFCTVAQQCAMVMRVKRAQSSYIEAPRTTTLNADRISMEKSMKWDGRYGGISSLMVVEDSTVSGARPRLLGVVSRSDLVMAPHACTAKDVMVPRERMVTTARSDLPPADAAKLMLEHRISDLPIVDEQGGLVGLITRSDVRRQMEMAHVATLDERKRLRVGAAVGVKLPHDLDRAVQLVRAGADILVVDIAHGHSEICCEMLRALKANPVTKTVDIVAGNIATAEAARCLIEAGADGLKCGIGGGSVCITRIVAGSGVPQLSALMDVCRVARAAGVPVIADGGCRQAGDVAKAIAAGADTVMLGSMLAGTDETPGRILTRDGQKKKLVRGMAGADTNAEKARREGKDESEVYENIVPEGVEGTVPYRGAVSTVLHGVVGGLRSGMSYSNARTITEMKDKAIFVRMTGNGLRESSHHSLSKL